MYRVLLVVSLVGAVVGQLLFNKTCGVQTTVSIDFNAFQGEWYQFERIANSDEQGECSKSTYGPPTADSGQLFNQERVDNDTRWRNGTYARGNVDATIPGRFFTNIGSVNATNYLLEVDYDSHALLYSCRNVEGPNPQSQVWAWKLSRNRTLSPVGQNRINHVVNNHVDLRYANWRPTDHGDATCDGTLPYAPPLLALLSYFLFTKHMF